MSTATLAQGKKPLPRRHKRYPFSSNLYVTVESGCTPIQGRLLDISAGGFAIVVRRDQVEQTQLCDGQKITIRCEKGGIEIDGVIINNSDYGSISRRFGGLINDARLIEKMGDGKNQAHPKERAITALICHSPNLCAVDGKKVIEISPKIIEDAIVACHYQTGIEMTRRQMHAFLSETGLGADILREGFISEVIRKKMMDMLYSAVTGERKPSDGSAYAYDLKRFYDHARASGYQVNGQ